MNSLIPIESAQTHILLIRGQKVILDADLAELYGVPTKRLNEQVKRNKKRFPSDFMIRLTQKEKEEVVAICDHLQNLRFSPVYPYAFTEHGALMVSSILNTPTAIETGIFIVRAFVKLRDFLADHKEIATRFMSIEDQVANQAHEIRLLWETIVELKELAEEKFPRIEGFKKKD